MAWLDPETMLAKLVAQAKQQSEINKAKPMFAEEKVIALDGLVVRKFELELEEVAIIDALQDAGHADARRRHDIDSAALLGVKEPKGLMRVV